VARRLRAAGHDVYPMTLTGLGERVHLSGPEVDLETHITDVTNVITFEELTDVILVGHSYAGIVVTGVADRMDDRLSQLVYLDSAPFADGMSMLDVYPPQARTSLEQTVAAEGDGWRWPFPLFEDLARSASLAGLGETERDLMQRKAVAQPFRTYHQPLHLSHSGPSRYQRVAIACDDMRTMVAAGVPAIVAMTEEPWRYLELPTGHWPMLSMPAELASLLDTLASEA
jgi:pimeloyl-ACP methyl ester carboxylesterase